MTRPFLVLLLLASSVLTAQEGVRMGPFTIETRADALDVISQDSTGTCWSYATVSFLESEVLRTTGKEVDLSEMYLVRHAIVEKARRYVMLGGRAQFSQGGLSHDIIAMARMHGIVPQADYDALPHGQSRHDHGEMFRLLDKVVKGFTEKDAKRPGKYWLHAIGGIADAYMGKPPTSVSTLTVNGKPATPKQYAEHLKLDLDGYVQLMSFSYAPFHQDAELLVPDNWMRFQGYKNLPLDEMMAALDHALARGYTVAVDMDVSEKGFSARNGTARLTKAMEKPGAITQAVRDEMFRSGDTTDDHLMHVTGVARHEDGTRYYVTKNSWGAIGPYEGHLFISENFMRAKLLAFMVHESGLPKQERGSATVGSGN